MMKRSFHSTETAWCPGCGNFNILDTLIAVLNQMELDPKNVLLVGGIGQAPKTNQYVNANGFSGLHGRALPVAAAAKIANEKLTVIVNTGDGDSYGEGGNHFLHNIRRNVDFTHFVHNNQIYGLTKGQTSPTSDGCWIQPGSACNLSLPFNPLAIAIAAGAGFVARSFSGDKEHLALMMEEAINHKGYALVDILQPCITFNKVNTFSYYKERVYYIEDDYDKTDKAAALTRSLEWAEGIPLGILYQNQTPTFSELRPEIMNGTPLIDKQRSVEKIQQLISAFA